jgi:hypothetical protein
MHGTERPAPLAAVPAPAAEVPSVAPPAPRRRAATPEDLEHIAQLTLEDFDIDFDRVVLPDKAEGERFTKAELDAAVDSFKNALRER